MSFYKEVPGRQTTLESTLKFDTEPKAGSTNPVTSDGVKNAIDGAVGDAAESLQEQIDDIAEKAGSGYIPKGESTVATLNALSGQENGELYTMTDAGTLTDGSLAVVAGDTVAWDEANSVWYKAMDYAPAQYGTDQVKNLPTTITAFREGDVIPVDGTHLAKMPYENLLKVTAETTIAMSKAVRYSVARGCYYGTDFSTFQNRSDRAGTGILSYGVGQYIVVYPITGYKISIDQSDVLAPTASSISTGWLSVKTIVKVSKTYQSIMVKKDNEGTFYGDDLGFVSGNLILGITDSTENESNDSHLATTSEVHKAIVSSAVNEVYLKPFLMQGTCYYNSSNVNKFDINTHRCCTPCIETALKDLYLTPKKGYKFWAFTYDSGDLATDTFDAQIHYGQVGLIPKGTRYRIVIATDPENAETSDPSTWADIIRIVSTDEKVSNKGYLLAMDGKCPLGQVMERGDFNPSTYVERDTQRRARTIGIQYAETDMYVSIKSGYKFWGVKFDTDDTPLGNLFAQDVFSGTIALIPKGTRYRLVVARDPETSLDASDPIVFSEQLVLSSVIDHRISAFETTDVSTFWIYGVSSEKRRTSTKRVTEFTPYTEIPQSIAIDRENGVFYSLYGNVSNNVRKYSIDGTLLEVLTNKGTTGHDNDACYVNGLVYITGTDSSPNKFYVWDVENGGSTEIDVSSIPNNPNGSTRALSGVCQKDSDNLYLVCIDLDPDNVLDVKVDDVISIYNYEISTGTITYVGSIARDLVYVQGCTYVDGLLYISGNVMTTSAPNNYKGMALKVVDTTDYSVLNEIVFSGNFENEGLDYFATDCDVKLITCFAKYAHHADLCKFIPNW